MLHGLAILVLAATTDTAEAPDLLFTRNHLSISISGGISQAASIKAEPNNYQLSTAGQFGFEGGLNYHVNMSKEFSMIYGLHLAAPSRNFDYHIYRSDYPVLPYDLEQFGMISDEYVFLLRVPVSLEKRWFTTDRRYWSASVGISLVYAVLQEESWEHYFETSSGYYQYLQMNIETNNRNRPWINYHLGASRSWILGNNTIVSGGVIANFSFTNFQNGNFWISVPGEPDVSGKYHFKGGYFGLTAGYAVPMRKLRKKR